MQITIASVLLYSLRTISLAADVTVYKRYDYYYAVPQKLEPVAVSQFPWMFSFYSGLMMYIRLKNTSPSVTAINIACDTDDRTFELYNTTEQNGRRESEDYYHIYADKSLNTTKIKIWLNLYVSNMLCSSLVVAVANITDEPLREEYPHTDKVLYDAKKVTRLNNDCVLVVDLKNKCDRNFQQPPPSHNVLIYVIPSVIVLCVIIPVIYLIRVKKCCHRNSPPVTLELNTSHHEPFYLNMLFRRECDREIAEIDQHIYEEIAPQVTEGG